MNIEDVVMPMWRTRLGWDQLKPESRQALAEFALHNYSLAAPTVGHIDRIKHRGHLVILNDGSRWEIDDIDTDVVASWEELDDVAVIDGVMYRLEGVERVEVTADDD